MYNKHHHPSVGYNLKQTRSHIYMYIYIYIYIYIYLDTQDTLYYVQVGIQRVSHTKCNAINCINKSSSMQKEQ